MWSAVDVDSGEILAIYASWSRNMLIALKFLRMVLGRCINKPLIVVDRGPWYRWALERLGLKYRYQRFGLRNRIEDYTAATAIIRNIITIINLVDRIKPKQYLGRRDLGRTSSP